MLTDHNKIIANTHKAQVFSNGFDKINMIHLTVYLLFKSVFVYQVNKRQHNVVYLFLQLTIDENIFHTGFDTDFMSFVCNNDVNI